MSCEQTEPAPSGPPVAVEGDGEGPGAVTAHPGRRVALAGHQVERTLPNRRVRTVGAWCFADQARPRPVSPADPLDVAPHPHIGLQTVTWVVDGAVHHLDSLGSDRVIVPGQLNLMTAGEGIAHAELSPPTAAAWGRSTGSTDGPPVDALHLVQLWVALPEAARHGPPAFEHHPTLPVVAVGPVEVTVLAGAFGGEASPATVFSPLVGADVRAVEAGRVVLPLRPDWDHALVVVAGSPRAAGRPLAADALHHVARGRAELAVDVAPGDRVVLLGGAPLDEPLLLWWNLAARTHEEVVAARRDWEAGSARFGAVPGYDGPVIPAPPVAGHLRPQSRA